MKNRKKITVTWIGIILFLIILFTLYNNMEGKNYFVSDNDPKMADELNPIVEENKNTLIDQAALGHIELVITEGVRSVNKQNQLYEQGRTKNGNIVTYAKGGESYHNYGLAIDYALKDADGNIIWDIDYDGNNNGKSDWFEVAEMAKKIGFEWGGDWNGAKDYPHLQMTFGLSINQLKEGLRPTP